MSKLLILLFFLPFLLYAQGEDFRDPFENVLPLEEIKQDRFSTDESKEEIKPPSILVEGVLWGTDMPQVIIDGEVYKVGDRLRDIIEVQIFEIEKNKVLIRYRGKIFQFTVQKKGR